MLEEMIELRRQLDEREREKEEEARRIQEAKFIASRTRMQMQAQSASTKAGSNANRVLVNPLFANAGSARKIGRCFHWLLCHTQQLVLLLCARILWHLQFLCQVSRSISPAA
jgi:hypothetical protein